MRIAFPFNAQDHHVFHALPIAARLSQTCPEHDVTVLARSQRQAAMISRLARAYPGQRLDIDLLARPKLLDLAARRWPLPKAAILLANARRLAGFDALVLPERTSLLLKSLGVRRPTYIHCFHGASGHDRTDDPRLKKFDLLLAPSHERLQRMRRAGAARDGHAAVIGYAKFDLAERLHRSARPRFANGRPTVLYNPHHNPRLSSWHEIGPKVLDWFAAQDRFNLIFAPHVRLFDPVARHLPAFDRWQGLPHIHIDLGSEASVDMRHQMAADIYLGDASSQVTEFVARPRPVLFLDPRRTDWHGDPDYRTWTLGPVEHDVAGMASRLATVPLWQRDYRAAQRVAAARAFPQLEGSAPDRAAAAIDAFLWHGSLPRNWDAGLLSDARREPRERRQSPAN
jgi:hypothetical protein